VAATNAPISGNGTAANPLGLAPGTAPGQILVWNGTSWVNQPLPIPLDLTTSGGLQFVTGTSYNGTLARQMRIVPGTAAGQVLAWDGASWNPSAPGTNQDLTATGVIAFAAGTTYNGAVARELRINPGTNGQVLTTSGGTVQWATPTPPNAWTLTGNAGTNPTTNFVGTTDAQGLSIRTNGQNRITVSAGGNVGINTATPAPGHALDIATNDAIKLPVGTTAQRPAAAQEGAFRYNSTLRTIEFFDGTRWVPIVVPQVPIGAILPYAGGPVPAGYRLCDGSTLSRTAFADLFATIGTSWGAGDGSTTFHIPDLRGRFLRGRDAGTGNDPDAASRTASAAGGATGNNVGTLQGHALQTHTHGGSIGTTDLSHTHNWGGHWSQDDSREFTNDNGDGNGNTISDNSFWWGGNPATTGNPDSRFARIGLTNVAGGHSHGGATGGIATNTPRFYPFDDNMSDNRVNVTFNGGGVCPPTGWDGRATVGNFMCQGLGDHTHSIAVDGDHNHLVDFYAHRHWIRTRATTAALGPNNMNHTHTLTVTAPTGANTASETRPTNAAVDYIIKVND
jgi:microcystin-dependent protein